MFWIYASSTTRIKEGYKRITKVTNAKGPTPSAVDTGQSHMEGKLFQFLQLNVRKRKGVVNNVMSDNIHNRIGGRGNHSGHMLRYRSWKNRQYIGVG